MKKFLIFLLVSCPLICNSQVTRLSFTINSGIEKGKLKQNIETNTTKLLLALNEAFQNGDESPQLDPKIISGNGINAITNLWTDEHFYCYSNKISENILQHKDYYQVRNIPIIWGKSDTIDIVLDYLPDGKINDLFIGLSPHQYKGVMNVSNVVDQTRRQVILNFIENLRNYYIKKDINNIRLLYDDKALIIIGKVLKPANIPMDQIQANFTQNQVKYIVLTRDEYIARLESVFSSINYLFLNFENIQVLKHRKYSDFYGVLLEQSWKSSGYDDRGWLFLLIQFKETTEPVIWVRTWQNVKDTPLEDVFGLHNFVIRQKGNVTN